MRQKKLILMFSIFCFETCLHVNAKIPRNQSAKAEFQRSNPCPSTGQRRGACPGYVKDHIAALACGGADSPENMQWQTIADAKAKDKWERKDCKPTSLTKQSR